MSYCMQLLGSRDGLPVLKHTGQLEVRTPKEKWQVQWSLLEHTVVAHSELGTVIIDDFLPMAIPAAIVAYIGQSKV